MADEVAAKPVLEVGRARDPALKCLKFLSHGTLESRDLERSRLFYEECLGIETVRTSPVSLMIRLGGNNTIAVVQSKKKHDMPLLNHNGLDVESRGEVDECHAVLKAGKDRWGIGRITSPADQHGTYSFYFSDPDDNWWEILCNPKGGYGWMFTQGRDLESWGAGAHDDVNPNDYKGRARKAKDGV
jgi:catechol-2,3-dioxygenase